MGLPVDRLYDLFPTIDHTHPDAIKLHKARHKQVKLLNAYLEFRNIKKAAELVGMTIWDHSTWMKDPGYAKAVQIVRSMFGAELEAVTLYRAINGVEKPVFQNGELIGSVKEFDHSREKTMLKAFLPGQYHDKLEVQIKHQSTDELKARLMAATGWDGEGEPPEIMDAELAQPVEPNSVDSHTAEQ